MNGLNKTGDTGNVRTRHGSTRDNIKWDTPPVSSGERRSNSSGIRSQYIHTRGCDIRLQQQRVINKSSKTRSEKQELGKKSKP